MLIAVTKEAGFIGSQLTDQLLELGHYVLIIDNLSTGKRENLNPQAFFTQMNAHQKSNFILRFELHLPEIVFHHPAQTLASISMEDLLKDATFNVKGTLNMLTSNILVGLYSLQAPQYIASQ